MLKIFFKYKQICAFCSKDGATIACSQKNCQTNYHFHCAFKSGCSFRTGKSSQKAQINERHIYCPNHNSDKPNLSDYLELSQKCYVVDLNEELYRKKNNFLKFETHGKNGPFILVGSLQVTQLGELETISDHKEYLFPLGYTCNRYYWSTTELGKKITYTCRIRSSRDVKLEKFNAALDKKSSLMKKRNESLKLKRHFDIKNFSDNVSIVQVETEIEMDEIEPINQEPKLENEDDGEPIAKMPKLEMNEPSFVAAEPNPAEINETTEQDTAIMMQLDGQNDKIEVNAQSSVFPMHNSNLNLPNQSKCIIKIQKPAISGNLTSAINLPRTNQMSFINNPKPPVVYSMNKPVLNINQVRARANLPFFLSSRDVKWLDKTYRKDFISDHLRFFLIFRI